MFLKSFKKTLAVILAALLIFAAIPATVFATDVTVIEGKLSISDTANTGKLNSGTYQATAKGSIISKKSSTITITNISGGNAQIAFNYTVEKSSAFTIDGANADASGSYSKFLTPNSTIKIVITSNSGLSNTTVTLKLTNITFTEAAASSNITYDYDDNLGSVTVNGEVMLPGNSSSLDSGASAELVATPVSGARFLGWVNTTDSSVLSTSATYSLQAASDMSIKAVFVNKNSVPYFGVGSYIFDNLNTAANFASSANTKTVVVLNDATLPAGDYTIPSGVTLLVPFDGANTLYTTTPGYNTTYAKPTAYRTLTMADGANITVNGSLSVSGKYIPGVANKKNACAPTGPVGFISMNKNSSITVNGNLYAYGFIVGEGNVVAKSGASVYEMFQFPDYRGGDGSTDIPDPIFPMSQFYIQNIEVPLTIESGATEYCYAAITVSVLGTQGTSVAFLGKEGSMFELIDGSITKRYDGSTDRLIIDVNGNISISPIKMSLSVYSVNSDGRNLAINGNITVNINSGSNCIIDQDLALLPGSVFNIENGANVTVTKDTNVYIYDADDWGNYCGSENVPTIPVIYAPSRTYNRPTTLDALEDASVKIDGFIDASAGFVYTTAGGANIYSTGTGKALITRGSDTTTQQATQYAIPGEGLFGTAKQAFNVFQIPITPAKLKNADGSYIFANCPSGTYSYTNGSWDFVCQHEYEQTAMFDATCGEDGYKTFTCPCGDSYNEIIPATGEHIYDKKVTDPTCTDDGFTTYTCACGDSYVSDKVAALGHTYDDGVETTAPTCTEDGVKTFTCHCGDSYTEAIPALGHSYKSVVTQPTCTDAGYTTYTCDCGHSYVADEIDALGHTYDEGVETTAPTCTVEGVKTYTCHCGDTYTETIAALGHRYKTTVTDPTCTDDGFTTYTCACGDSYVSDKVAALGHTYDDGVETTAPTCTEDGVKTFTCHCGDTYTEAIAALGHRYKTTVTDPTCTDDGFTTYTCACGDSYVADKVAALGHDHYIGEDGNMYCNNCDFGNVSHIDFVDSAYVNGYGWGDINNDGFVNYTDLQLLNAIVCDYQFANGELACKAADVNGDGDIDMKDIVRIKKIMGIIPGGGVGEYTTLSDIPDFIA